MNTRIMLVLLLLVVFAGVAYSGLALAETGSALPLLVGGIGLVLSAWQLVAEIRRGGAEPVATALGWAEWRHLLWFVLLLVVVLLVGFVPGAPLWVLAYLRWGREERWRISLGLAALVLVLLWGLFGGLLGVQLFEGLLRTSA